MQALKDGMGWHPAFFALELPGRLILWLWGLAVKRWQRRKKDRGGRCGPP
jgi:hypothetical protein